MTARERIATMYPPVQITITSQKTRRHLQPTQLVHRMPKDPPYAHMGR